MNMKKFIKYVSLFSCIGIAIYLYVSWFKNPDTTELRLLLDHWKAYVLMMVCAALTGWFWKEY